MPDFEIGLVICNRKDARIKIHAKNLKVPFCGVYPKDFLTKNEYEMEIHKKLELHKNY